MSPVSRAAFKALAKQALARPLDAAVRMGALRASRRHADALVVLTFHRVMSAERRAAYAYPGLAVTEDELDAVLRIVCAEYDVGPLTRQHARFVAGEKTAKPLLALTFDDGQLDDLAHAAPVLARHGVHATFYVPVDAIDRGEPLAHDRIGFAWTAISPAQRAAVAARFGLPVADDAGALMEHLKPRARSERDAVLAALEAATGHAKMPAAARPLTWDEAAALARAGHEIGSHACSHTPLPELDDAALRDECTRSKARIEAELGLSVRSLCYPNGDADARVASAARAAGYENAVTTRWGENHAGADPHLLARFDVDARRITGNDGVSAGLLALRLSGARRGLADTARSAACVPHEARPTVAYFVSEYPSRSHTFIRREIDALRAQGVQVVPFAIRRPAPEALLDERDRASFEETTPILPAEPRRLVRAHLTALAHDPSAYVMALHDATSHRLPGAKNLLWSVFHFAEGIALADGLARSGAAHLHVHFANAGANVGRIAARYLDIPYSMTLHGTSDFEYPAGPLLGEKLTEASFAACISSFGQAQAMRLLPPEAWEKLALVRCGVELGRMPERASRGDDRIEVVCVGRISSEKGHLGLLEAFAYAHAKEPRLSLVLIGDGPLRKDVEARVAALGLSEAVRLTGALPEAETLATVARADLFALPSFMEGIPLVLMEAMALSIPVVAPCVSGIPELVQHEKTGLLYTVSRWGELGDAILRLAHDPALRDALGREGRAKVASEFAVENAVKPLIERFARVR